MPIAEWENLYQLITPEGTLDLNDRSVDPGHGVYLTVKEGADSGTDVRSTSDPVPQGFGTIWHRGFANGYVLKLTVEYWVPGTGNALVPATELTNPTAQEMDDVMMRHYRSIFDGGGRILYAPAGLPVRLADDLFAIAKPQFSEGQAQMTTVLEFGSELPYLIDFTQTLTQLSAGSPTATLTNTGSAPYYPVFRVYGDFDYFVLTNETTEMQIIYDDTLPGAVAVDSPDYIEIITFRNTVYLNGDGASRKAGIYIPTSDFWTLDPGDNIVTIEGAGGSTGNGPNVDILWQAAWF